MIQIKLSGVTVDDQDKAHKFYTDIVGFTTKQNIDLGEYKWLTVGQPDSAIELLLEPDALPAAKIYQKALFDQGIPANAFSVDDIDAEYKRLSGLGVKFKSEPKEMGPVKLAIFDDTCGNLIQLYQEM
jgi:predicted enzyme related to lactoylglutathione lyase|tara:strand:- start:715 stop:1098 length:384 start_codon:yes stop_codon:yes gene_type:complete